MTRSYSILSFDGLIENCNKTYLSSTCFNGLIEVDNNSNIARIIKKFPKENVFMYLLHHKLYKNGNEIIFTPDLAKNIHVMDIDSNEITCIDFKSHPNCNARCIDSYIWDNKLWLFFSNRKMPIISMDLSTHEITHYPQLIEPLEKITKDEDSVIFWAELWKDQGQVYGVLYDSEYIVHIDLIHMKTKIFSVAPIEKKLAGIAVDGNTVYLTEMDSYEIIVYSLLDGSKKKYMPDCSLYLEKGAGYLYSNILVTHGRIILVPNYDNRILCMKNNRITYFCNMPEGYKDIGEDGRRDWRRFYSTESNGEMIRLFPAKANMLLEIHLEEEKARGRSYKMPSEWIDTEYYTDYVTAYVKESAKNAECMYENEVVNLKDYIQVLESSNMFLHPDLQTEQQGRLIWNLFR